MTPPEQEYREIPLTKGQVTKVSPWAFEKFGHLKWIADWNKSTRSYYATRTEYLGGGRGGVYRKIRLSRAILGLDMGDKRMADHKNHDTLDNTDENLRPATPQQNAQNMRVKPRSKSGLKGVCWHKVVKKWQASIRVDGKRIHLGSYVERESAEKAYRDAARRYFGEFACET